MTGNYVARRVLAVLLGLAGLTALSAAPARAQNLTVADVGVVISQAVTEATARGRLATIAVVDRVGNVLGVFRMTGAATTITVSSGRGVATGLEGAAIANTDTLLAIAKAVTGAYLSSAGNAFSTRVASQIVQEHFNVGEKQQPGGPLFGVQFSQLPCSDLNLQFPGVATRGPKRSPAGLSADTGGFPLYKNGRVVGGVGAISDGVYSLDLDIINRDVDPDEVIALAGTNGFDAPIDIRANRITAGGRTLRYSDATPADFRSNPSSAPAFPPAGGALVAVAGYANAAVIAGQVFGAAGSGYIPDPGGVFNNGRAFVLENAAGANRFPPTAGGDAATVVGGAANVLTAAEVNSILRHALDVALLARAQIRRPLGSYAQVTISVVDTNGLVLGLVRTPDAPVFGTDVSLQKGRTAVFFSRTTAGAEITALALAVDYIAQARSLIGPTAFADGIAYSARAIGNIARPYFPDGVDGQSVGPLSRPFQQWSPFSTGLQLDLVSTDIANHLTNPGNATNAAGCTGLAAVAAAGGSNRLANGIQIFAGGVPIYRNGVLVGGVGVSGDGIDQDDMIAALGLYHGGKGNGLSNARPAVRSDNLSPRGTRLRYVSCPFTPFLGITKAQNVCGVI